jgi:hypothetical protein
MKLKKLGPVRTLSKAISVDFGFEQLFLVLRRTLPLVGNDARDRWRNSRISRRPPRFRAFFKNFFTFSHPGLKPEF